MSWLARSIAATLSSAPSDDDDDHSEATSGDKSPDHAANADAEEDEQQPDTPSRGVKGDISELTESLTRRFWGIFTFLRTELCSTNMSEACFWKIYFVLLHSKLNKEDAELLSTAQILEAREELLQSSPRMKKVASEEPGGSSESRNVSSTQAEYKEFSPSSIQDNSGISEATSFHEPTPDPLPVAEADKHPISTSELEIVDKSVIEEELVVKNEIKNQAEKPNLYTPEDDDDKEVEDWLEDMDHEDSKIGNITSVGQDEDVSFSDLEDDDDD